MTTVLIQIEAAQLNADNADRTIKRLVKELKEERAMNDRRLCVVGIAIFSTAVLCCMWVTAVWALFIAKAPGHLVAGALFSVMAVGATLALIGFVKAVVL
jgi:hypothetical protein